MNYFSIPLLNCEDNTKLRISLPNSKELSDFVEKLDENVHNITEKLIEYRQQKIITNTIVENEFKTPTNETFQKLTTHVKEEFKSDANCVYKICSDEKKNYFVVLQKHSHFLTNESRTNVIDGNYAKFRANKLLVKQIIDLTDMNPDILYVKNITSYLDEVHFRWCIVNTQYEVNKIINPDKYIVNPQEICAGGIHYFKTMKAAFFLWQFPPKNYNGYWLSCCENGGTQTLLKYVDGICTRNENM